MNWADVEDTSAKVTPQEQQNGIDADDENVKLIVEEIVDPKSGEKTVVKKKVIKKTIEKKVHPSVKGRLSWKKFGFVEENLSDLDPRAGSSPSEDFPFRLHSKLVNDEEKLEAELYEKKSQQLEQAKAKIQPLKTDPKLAGIYGISGRGPLPLDPSSQMLQSSLKYVPHSLSRDGSSLGLESMYGGKSRRDEANTLRITNLSADTTEGDLKELTYKFGPTQRVYVARDRETNQCKGFAFVTYQTREDAERAMNGLNGHGYDNLILHVEWANVKEKEP